MPRQLGFDEPARCWVHSRIAALTCGGLASPLDGCLSHRADDARSMAQAMRRHQDDRHLPRDLRDSMPRFNDEVAMPSDVPAEYEPDLKARWAAWSQIWGTPPWQTK